MKKSLFTFIGVVILVSCQSPTQTNGRVVTTLFPQYSIARFLLNDIAEVDFLLESGQASHDFEPTPSDVVSLNQASVVFFSSEQLEPWIHNIENTARGQLVDLSYDITLLEGHDHEEENANEDDHDHGEFDPHYWIDPANALVMLSTISSKLIEVFPEEEPLLISRTNVLEEAFGEVVDMYESLLSTEEEFDVVFAGHNVFGYLEIYGIHVNTPYGGFTDDVLPTAESITDFITIMETLKTTILYVTSTDNQAVIDALVNTNESIETEELFSMEAVPSPLDIANITYQEMLQLNYEALAKSL